ncbi:MAG: GxxExxY protein [candidate division WOR-3 bacterium]
MENINLPKDLLHSELTHKILNAAFEVHNYLGCGFLEKVYENALLEEFRSRNLPVENQKLIEVFYKRKKVGNYISDIIIDKKVIVEVKACDKIEKIHEAQILNYLKATGIEVGVILNFAKPKLEYKRLVLSRKNKKNEKRLHTD